MPKIKKTIIREKIKIEEKSLKKINLTMTFDDLIELELAQFDLKL